MHGGFFFGKNPLEGSDSGVEYLENRCKAQDSKREPL
jgi:hypothetical protein